MGGVTKLEAELEFKFERELFWNAASSSAVGITKPSIGINDRGTIACGFEP